MFVPNIMAVLNKRGSFMPNGYKLLKLSELLTAFILPLAEILWAGKHWPSSAAEKITKEKAWGLSV